MPLELRRQRDGSLRPNWYARYEVNGQRFTVNLNVKVKGVPPASLTLQGDTDFECSRATAQAKLNEIVDEARSKRNATHLIERIYESKTGETIKGVKLEALPKEWPKIPRRSKPSASYEAQCVGNLTSFTEFMQREYPKAVEIAQVTRAMALAFMETEEKRGVTGRTWNDKLQTLRSTFRHLLPAGHVNPFYNVVTKETETIFRKPFSPEELKAILEVARADEFMRPLLVVGMCTAMRRGDCCLLDWKDVDLKNRFIAVKTAKTGNTVSIPIFPLLLEELKARRAATKGEPKGYVFPEQAKMYLENADGITRRVKQILARALCTTTAPGQKASDQKSAALPKVEAEEAARRGKELLATLPASDKRERMVRVFNSYAAGKNINEVVAETGVSKASASAYLNEIEAGAGCRIVRGRVDGTSTAALLRRAGTLLNAEGGNRMRRASVRDFHSFRVTWVTLALTAGVPLELVQKVTGHKTTDVVLKHYFQPGREAFRTALQSAMPKLLTNGQKSPRDEMREIVERLTPKTLKADKARLLELLKAA